MKAVLALLWGALLAGCATPQRAGSGEDALRRHIAVLAADAMAGRTAATPGGDATERYVADQFAAAGLAPGAADGSWLQPVAVPVDRKSPAQTVIAHNIVGRLAGTGGGGEAVLFMAHWDHLGLCRPEGAPDRICNGAVDNASGVAALIEIARGLAKAERPARDILFVATAGEELGLIGAKALAADPPLPLAGIVAALNLDTVAVAPRGAAVTIVGRGMTGLDPIVDRTAGRLGRTVDTSIRNNILVRRQDGWALLEKGVPAILVGGAFGPALERFFAARYHRPNDDLASGVELGGAAEDVALHVALGRALADPAVYPSARRAVTMSPALDSAQAPH